MLTVGKMDRYLCECVTTQEHRLRTLPDFRRNETFFLFNAPHFIYKNVKMTNLFNDVVKTVSFEINYQTINVLMIKETKV
jgi:hypothetical protein